MCLMQQTTCNCSLNLTPTYMDVNKLALASDCKHEAFLCTYLKHFAASMHEKHHQFVLPSSSNVNSGGFGSKPRTIGANVAALNFFSDGVTVVKAIIKKFMEIEPSKIVNFGLGLAWLCWSLMIVVMIKMVSMILSL
ncbi:hypothetical protein Lal_00027416 [Lupinus albus]|nr:hypothetical protein Lal_00027416 [Lupinus albus]